MFESMSGKRTGLTGVAAAALLLAALAGCSAPTGEGTADVPSANGSGVTDAYPEWELDYTQCLRDNGIDIADPDPVKGVLEQPEHDDAYRAAAATCEQEVGGPPTNANGYTDQELYDGMLEYAQCLRDNGVDIADPVRGEALIMPEGDVPQEALDTCA